MQRKGYVLIRTLVLTGTIMISGILGGCSDKQELTLTDYPIITHNSSEMPSISEKVVIEDDNKNVEESNEISNTIIKEESSGVEESNEIIDKNDQEDSILEEEKASDMNSYLVTFPSDFYEELVEVYNTKLIKLSPEALNAFFSNEHLEANYGNKAYSAYIRMLFKHIINGNVFDPIYFGGNYSAEETNDNTVEINKASNRYSDQFLSDCYEIIKAGKYEEEVYINLYEYMKYKDFEVLGIPFIELYKDHYYNLMEVYLRIAEKGNNGEISNYDQYIVVILGEYLNEMEQKCLDYDITLSNVYLQDDKGPHILELNP